MAGMKRKISEILSLTMLLFLHLSWVQAAGLEADLVLYNGKILTADSEDPARFTVAEAVAAYDGKFVVVGSNQEAMETAGPSTRRIDLAGRTVLPGLIETHLHVHTQATGHYQVRPVDRTDAPIQWTNKADGLAQLRTLALQKKLGDWIVVSNLGSRVEAKILSESSPERPTLAELDRATPRNPLVIVLGGNDPLLLNSRSLNMLLQRYPQGIPGIVKAPGPKKAPEMVPSVPMG